VRAPVARLHLITPDADPVLVLAATAVALDAGAPWVQVRTKRVGDGGPPTDRARLELVAAVVARCAPLGATCVVDDRVDLALAVGAAGVHLGDEDLPLPVARGLAPATFVVGATCRDPDAARRAEAEGATYLGVGPVYATGTKAGLPDPIGVRGLARVAAAVQIPVIAIAGVTAAQVPEVLDAGAHGIAVIGAVYGAPDPAEATRELLDALSAAAPMSSGSAGSAPARLERTVP
jgi:thiamine-phosphate pyrophosphorylase